MADTVPRGISVEEGVKNAQRMAREAFQTGRKVGQQIDISFGGPSFRQTVLEPLLQKERQITALETRLERGGRARGSDALDLRGLIARRREEYELLRCNCALNLPSKERQDLVEAYIESRRRQLYLGDASAVRRVLVWRRLAHERLSA